MEEIHAHEVLRMMEGNNYNTKAELRDAIASKFGENSRFYTCSVKGQDIDALIDFLEAKGKFKPTQGGCGFTMDITKVCESY